MIILLAAIVKFSIHLFIAPGYGFFGDELYTIALSRRLAFGCLNVQAAGLCRVKIEGKVYSVFKNFIYKGVFINE